MLKKSLGTIAGAIAVGLGAIGGLAQWLIILVAILGGLREAVMAASNGEWVHVAAVVVIVLLIWKVVAPLFGLLIVLLATPFALIAAWAFGSFEPEPDAVEPTHGLAHVHYVATKEVA
jgi:hypothetical protein